MALLAVFTDGEGLFAVMTGPAIFPAPQSLHVQGVIHVGTVLLFLEQDIMTVTATYARRLVTLMTEHHRRETFGILEHDYSGSIIRLNRRSTPQQTNCNEYRHTENQLSNFHRTPFSNDGTL